MTGQQDYRLEAGQLAGEPVGPGTAAARYEQGSGTTAAQEQWVSAAQELVTAAAQKQ